MKDEHSMSEWVKARRGMGRIAAATTVFSLWHSLLCSRQAKESAAKLLGERRGRALYRLFFMAQSFLTSGALVLFILKQPSRTLYDRRGVARVVSWMGQAACLFLGWRASHDLGPRHFTGLESLQQLRDDLTITEAEAQGPSREPDNQLRVTGVYRWSRHPLEWTPILLLWLTPRLNTNWLAFNVLAALSSWLGAIHEEKRLLQKSPQSFAQYQKQVSFLIGKPSPKE